MTLYLNVSPCSKVVDPSDPTSIGSRWCPLQAKGHQTKNHILVTFVNRVITLISACSVNVYAENKSLVQFV